MNANAPKINPRPDHSSELNSLKNRQVYLQKEKSRLATKQDGWRTLTIWLGIAAAVFTLLAVGSQRSDNWYGRLQLAVEEELKPIDSRINDIEKEGLAWDIAVLTYSASKAEGQIALATQAAAEANKKAEEERFATARLEASIAPRRLTIEQQTNIGKACLGLTGRPIEVTSYSLDSEGLALGKQIVTSLHSAGLNVVPRLSALSVYGVFDFGVVVKGIGKDSGPVVECLKTALTDIGNLEVCTSGSNNCGTGSPESDPSFEASILIGVKPIVLMPDK